MKTCLILLTGLALAAGMARGQIIDIPSAAAELAPETPQTHDARMAWWRQARLGMFIHFGLYSTAAGEWNGKRTPKLGEWIMNDLKIPAGEYATLLGKFNPT